MRKSHNVLLLHDCRHQCLQTFLNQTSAFAALHSGLGDKPDGWQGEIHRKSCQKIFLSRLCQYFLLLL